MNALNDDSSLKTKYYELYLKNHPDLQQSESETDCLCNNMNKERFQKNAESPFPHKVNNYQTTYPLYRQGYHSV